MYLSFPGNYADKQSLQYFWFLDIVLDLSLRVIAKAVS